MPLAFREVALAFRRAPLLSLLGVVTIGFSLFAFGLFGLVAINIRSALRSVEDRVEIRAFLVDSAGTAPVETLLREVRQLPEVAHAGYVTPDSALSRARAELEEFRDVMDGAMLPASVEVRLREGKRDPATVQAVSRRLQASSIVADVRYGREWVEKLYRLRTVAGIAAIVLGSVFAAVALILIGSTIRLSILARTREIEIMRLVGATDRFVRLPYLLDGLLKGLAGGTLAVGLSYLTCQLVTTLLVKAEFFPLPLILLGIVAGGILGGLASWWSVGRHLRQVWREA